MKTHVWTILNHTCNAKLDWTLNILFIISSIVTQFYQNLKHFMKVGLLSVNRSFLIIIWLGDCLLYLTVNNSSLMLGKFPVFLGWTSTKQRITCFTVPSVTLRSNHSTTDNSSFFFGLILYTLINNFSVLAGWSDRGFKACSYELLPTEPTQSVKE